MTPASRAYSDFVKKGKLEEAAALEAIIANKVWGKERLLREGIITSSDAGCDRCGADFDSGLHKIYQCPCNTEIDDPCVQKSGSLAKKAKKDTDHKAKWFRAMLLAGLMSEPVGWKDEAECSPTVAGDFDSILHETKTAGTDGAGGPESEARNRTVAARWLPAPSSCQRTTPGQQ